MKTPGSAGFVAGVHRQLFSDRQSRDSTSETVDDVGRETFVPVVARVSVAGGFLTASLVGRSGAAAFVGASRAALAAGAGVGSLGGASTRGVSVVASGAPESLDCDRRSASRITRASRIRLPTTTHIALR